MLCNKCTFFSLENWCEDTFFNTLAQLSKNANYEHKRLNNNKLGISGTFCKTKRILGSRFYWLNGKKIYHYQNIKRWKFQLVENSKIIAENYELFPKQSIEKDSQKFFLDKVLKGAKYDILTNEDYFQRIESNDINKVNDNILNKKAYSKYFTSELLKHLTTLEDSVLIDSYKKSTECCSELIQVGNKITGKYCKQRWCIVCNRIRTAKMINNYIDELKQFSKPEFLTLTVKNCEYIDYNVKGKKYYCIPKNTLKNTFENMQSLWRYCYKKLKHTAKKNSYILKGIKKVECTYNFEENTYHPHFHFILDSKEISDLIMDYWLSYSYKFNLETNELAQKSKPVENEQGYLELFKYFSKIVSKTNEKEVIKLKKEDSIYTEIIVKKKDAIMIPALDNIFKTMRGKRVYDAFGIPLAKEDDFDIQAEQIENLQHQNITWYWQKDNWYNQKSEKLTDFSVNDNLLKMFENIYY